MRGTARGGGRAPRAIAARYRPGLPPRGRPRPIAGRPSSARAAAAGPRPTGRTRRPAKPRRTASSPATRAAGSRRPAAPGPGTSPGTRPGRRGARPGPRGRPAAPSARAARSGPRRPPDRRGSRTARAAARRAGRRPCRPRRAGADDDLPRTYERRPSIRLPVPPGYPEHSVTAEADCSFSPGISGGAPRREWSADPLPPAQLLAGARTLIWERPIGCW